MPAQLTYPGVYIEEVPSGVRTIVGVATSITAFIGWARRGPLNTPTDIFGLEQFTRVFGGLWTDSSLGYAVRDFFANGGSHALVVRLHHGATSAQLDVGGLALEASSPGIWGADVRATLDRTDVDGDLATSLGLTKDKLFNLTARLSAPAGSVETFHNLSVEDNFRNVAKVLAEKSDLVRVSAAWTKADPDWSKADPDDKQLRDKLGVLEKALAAARAGYQAGTNDKQAVTDAEKALRTAVDMARAALTDGTALTVADFLADTLGPHEGLHALDAVDLFNLLCIPPHTVEGDIEQGLVSAAMEYCEKRRAMLLVDPRAAWKDPSKGLQWLDDIDGPKANAAVYFPRLRQPNPLRGNAVETFVPCGAVAGVMARTDAARGVWKAPAGLEATLTGVPDLAVKLDDDGNGQLNPLGINCLRSFPVVGRVVWGARTLVGADVLASDWKYIPVRRLALYIEESLFRGTQWVVFEPNDEPLWAQIRLSVGSFMHQLFRQGAFQGRSPKEAYFVKCDAETTTQADRNLGVVNIVVGFAPLKPAEFVVIRLQQMAGQIET